MIPATGWLGVGTGEAYAVVAVPAAEPIAGTYRDYAGTEPTIATQPIDTLDVRSGAHVLGGIIGYGVGGVSLRFDMELHEVFGVALADMLTVPQLGPPSQPVGETRPGSAFAHDATRPATAAQAGARPATAWGDDG